MRYFIIVLIDYSDDLRAAVVSPGTHFALWSEVFRIPDEAGDRGLAVSAFVSKDVLQQPISKTLPDVVVQLRFESGKRVVLFTLVVLLHPILPQTLPFFPLADDVCRCDFRQ